MILTFNNSTETVGETPSIELKNIERELCLTSRLIAKVEGANPNGSAKDRAALYMIEAAEKQGHGYRSGGNCGAERVQSYYRYAR